MSQNNIPAFVYEAENPLFATDALNMILRAFVLLMNGGTEIEPQYLRFPMGELRNGPFRTIR